MFMVERNNVDVLSRRNNNYIESNSENWRGSVNHECKTGIV